MQRQIQREIIYIVADSIWSHKLRSALTLLGVIIGTAAVVMVGAVLTGLSRRVAQYTERTAPNAIYFTKGDRIGPSFSRPSADERQRKELTYEDAIAVAALPSPMAVSPQKIRGSYGPTANPPGMSARGREAINPLILGVWENFPDIVSVRVDSGRFFIASERERRAQVAVIGAGIARQLFEQADPLDQEARIDGRVFRIIGVLAPTAGEGVLGSDELDERIVYIPFETADKLYPEIEEAAIVARAPQGQIDKVIDEITALLRARRNVPAEAPNDFGVNRAEQVFDAVNQIIAGLAAIVLPIALAGLAIGGVGVMNIMLVSVKERSAEIGIRRALGARRSDVRNQFLIEAMTLTGVGGLIGIAIGFLFAFALRLFVNFPAAAPWWAMAAGFLASVTVGLIAGMWPALRAAGLDPVAAIRGD
jgi:putative ABC transport system permease protein